MDAQGDEQPTHGFDPTAYQRVGRHIADWFQHFSNNAVLKWAPHLIDVHECDYCDADALTKCIACQSSVCLVHAHVSFRGEAICDECVQGAISARPQGKRKKKRARPARVPPEVLAALAELGLDATATEPAIREAYKRLCRQYHPDRVARGTSSQQAAASIKMSRINQAYDLLKGWYARGEAA